MQLINTSLALSRVNIPLLTGGKCVLPVWKLFRQLDCKAQVGGVLGVLSQDFRCPGEAGRQQDRSQAGRMQKQPKHSHAQGVQTDSHGNKTGLIIII